MIPHLPTEIWMRILGHVVTSSIWQANRWDKHPSTAKDPEHYLMYRTGQALHTSAAIRLRLVCHRFDTILMDNLFGRYACIELEDIVKWTRSYPLRIKAINLALSRPQSATEPFKVAMDNAVSAFLEKCPQQGFTKDSISAIFVQLVAKQWSGRAEHYQRAWDHTWWQYEEEWKRHDRVRVLAAFTGQLSVLEACFSGWVDDEIDSSYLGSCLHAAVLGGHVKVAEFLMEKINDDSLELQILHESVLFRACQQNNACLVDLLLKRFPHVVHRPIEDPFKRHRKKKGL